MSINRLKVEGKNRGRFINKIGENFVERDGGWGVFGDGVVEGFVRIECVFWRVVILLYFYIFSKE